MYRIATLEAIDRTIRMSEIRCAPFDELLARIEHLWDDPYANEIVYRISNEKLSDNQYYALAESTRRLADAVDLLPSAQKAWPDRAIKRLLANMPAKVAITVTEQWLDHKRKFRREMAYRVLRDCGLSAQSGVRLLEVFNRTGDQECLRLIARFPVATANVDVQSILKKIDDCYWRMRLVEAALGWEKVKAMALADSYPYEFLRAIGRLKDGATLPKLVELFTKNSHDMKFVSLYAWVLGQLNAKDELLVLKAHVQKLS